MNGTSTRTIARMLPALISMSAIVAAPAHPQSGHQHRHGSDAPGVPLYEDLGDHHHEVTTADERAQRYFDQGMRLTYGFNYPEAVGSYAEAARIDPECAMCWWGMAWALGPNINVPMDSAAGARAYEASRKALALADRVTEKERAYIEAMAVRYGSDPTVDRARRDSAYARAMREVADRYPDDPDAQTLAAEALMLLSPWDYWTEDLRPKPGTEELLARLEPVTERLPEHAGACHFYIHAVEKAYPKRAEPCADRIAGLMPGANHIVHMPGHIYIRIGRYVDAIEANRHAIHAGDEFYDRAPQGGGDAYSRVLHAHNYHFLSFAAVMAGSREIAMESARQLAEQVDPEMMREPGFGALQHYAVTPLRNMVRFGLWEEILAEPAPPEDLPYMIGTWRYARGMAFARTGRLAEAERELRGLESALADPALDPVTVWELNTGRAILEVGRRVLAGEIAAARGDYEAAVAALEEGVRLESDLTYDEPPPWDLPVRHVLGAVLLEAGRAAEAERVYEAALRQFEQNGWALAGLIRSLEAQGKDAAVIRAEFREAWRIGDIELESSRL